MANFIKAQYNENDRTMVAWTDENRVELFYVYSQEEYDDRITFENLVEYLEDSVCEDEIPEEYGTYEKWAEAMWGAGDQYQLLFDACADWMDVLRLAGLDPYSDEHAYGEWTASMPVSSYEEHLAAA